MKKIISILLAITGFAFTHPKSLTAIGIGVVSTTKAQTQYDTLIVNQNYFMFPAVKGNNTTLLPSNKLISIIPSSGRAVASTFSEITIPYSQLTNLPTLTITALNGLTVTPGINSFTVTQKRRETYSGVTNASGVYTATFTTPYSVAPNIQANILSATDTQIIRITAISTTGFTVLVRNRVDVIGLLPSWANVNAAIVDVIVTEK